MQPHKIILACTFLGAVSFGTYAVGKQRTSRMSKNQVLWVAKQVALKNGYRLKDYLPLTATFKATDKEWTVVLDHKPPSFPGSRSLVFVDDRNGNATLFPGM